MGGPVPGGGIVEVDETFIGREPNMPKKAAWHHKCKVVSLVDRDTGRAKSIIVDDLKVSTLAPILNANIAKDARIFTDEAKHYPSIAKNFADHKRVNHKAKEYVRGEVHTNTIEGYFSIFKRGMKGVYQHCNKRHLHRYAAEFEFRYNNRVANGSNDRVRADIALLGFSGKRLSYARID